METFLSLEILKKYLCYELENQILHKYANFQSPIFITNNWNY